MILEVDNYTSLEVLSHDIKDAQSRHPVVTSSDNPMKVELSKDNFEKVQKDLHSFGAYGGVRTESELKTATWMVDADTYVSFVIKED
jgi:hypothetical protein